MRLSELLTAVPEARLRGDASLHVSGLAYDSRRVAGGDLFMTWTGFTRDGHEFCTEAVRRGAVACLVERPDCTPAPAAEILVPDARAAVARVAAHFYGHPTRELFLVGVTGTKGKTTTTWLVRRVLERSGPVGLVGTVAAIVGGRERPAGRTTPEAVDLQSAFRAMVDAGDRYCVTEVSSHALELHRADACRFQVGVFTNLGRDHLDFHGTPERYAAAKARLFTDLGTAAVANADDPMWRRVVGGTRVPVRTFGVTSEADVTARDVRLRSDGAEFAALHAGGRTQVRLALPGRFNVYNALAALTTGLVCGVAPADAAAAIGELKGVPGRFEVVPGEQGFTVVVDYAHTPDSLEQALMTARELATGRLIAVFGAGGDRDRGKRPLMGVAAARRADLVVLTSDNPRSEEPAAILADVEAGLRAQPGAVYRTIADRGEAIRWALAEAHAGDVVMIAGKGHETYQIFADRTIHFDDREVAAAALREMGY